MTKKRKKKNLFPLVQLLFAALGGIICLIGGAFLGSWLASSNIYTKAIAVALGLIFGYLIGVFLGVYVTGRLAKRKGSFWLTLAGGFISVIIITLLNEQIALSNSSLFVWFLLLVLFPALQTWGYYRFTIGKKIKIV